MLLKPDAPDSPVRVKASVVVWVVWLVVIVALENCWAVMLPFRVMVTFVLSCFVACIVFSWGVWVGVAVGLVVGFCVEVEAGAVIVKLVEAEFVPSADMVMVGVPADES